MSEEQQSLPHLSPEQEQAVRDRLKQIVNSYLRIDGERDHIKTIKDDLWDDFGIPKKKAKQIADMFYNNDARQKQEETEEVVDFYERLFSSGNE